MGIEDQLRHSFARHAARTDPSSDAWPSIESRLNRSVRRRTASSGIAVVALLLSAITFLGLSWAFRLSSGDGNPTLGTTSDSPPQPVVIATIPVGRDPVAITAGTEGVWVAAISNADCNELSGTVSLIDPIDNTMTATIPLSLAPVDIADGFGSVWVGGYTCEKANVPGQAADFQAVVARVDPQTGRVIASIPIGPFQVTGLAVTSDGVWATWGSPDLLSGALVGIDPTSNAIIDRVPFDRAVRDLTAGEGALWVWALGDNPSAAPFLRIDPQTQHVVGFDIASSGGAFAVGDGTLWVTGAEPVRQGSAELVVFRIDPKTAQQLGPPVQVADSVFQPFGVGDGGVWFIGGGGGTATISRLNTLTLQVDESIGLGSHQSLDAVLDSTAARIWVVDEPAGAVVRIDLQ